VRVYHHPGLRGLEIWHGLAGCTTLDQLRTDKTAYFAALDRFLRELHAGCAKTATGTSLAAAAGFERLILTGGDAAAASAVLTWPHLLADAGPYAARAGAEAVWRECGWRNPLAIDLGQTRIKVFTAFTSEWHERDETVFPFGAGAVPAELGRGRLREWIRSFLGSDHDGVLLALPNAVDGNGHAESSTYPGLFGDVEEIFGKLFPGTEWVVCNDAVLAARGYPPLAGEKTLSLTLGFGVGAALWL
jgi:hypothetical protein